MTGGARIQQRRGPVVLLVTVLALASLAGCGGSDADVQTYTADDSTITVDEDERFAVRLESNESTGFEWKVSQLPAALRLVSARSERADDAPPGAPGHQRFVFEARDAGTTTLELEYVQPFASSAPLTQPVSFEIVVR